MDLPDARLADEGESLAGGDFEVQSSNMTSCGSPDRVAFCQVDGADRDGSVRWQRLFFILARHSAVNVPFRTQWVVFPSLSNAAE